MFVTIGSYFPSSQASLSSGALQAQGVLQPAPVQCGTYCDFSTIGVPKGSFRPESHLVIGPIPGEVQQVAAALFASTMALNCPSVSRSDVE
jgi:hypothetical protein